MKLSEEVKLAVVIGVGYALYRWLQDNLPKLPSGPLPDFIPTNPVTGNSGWSEFWAGLTGEIPPGSISQAILRPHHPDYARLRACELGQSNDPKCRHAMTIAITDAKMREESL